MMAWNGPRRKLRIVTRHPDRSQASMSARAYLGVFGVSHVARGPCAHDRHLLTVDGSTQSMRATSVVVIRTATRSFFSGGVKPRTGNSRPASSRSRDGSAYLSLWT